MEIREFHISHSSSGDTHVFTMEGSLVDRTVPKLIGTVIDPAINYSGTHTVHLAMGLVDYIDSRGIGGLIQLHTYFSGRGIDLRIITPAKRVLETLRMSHADILLEIGQARETDHDQLARKRIALWHSHEYISKLLLTVGEGIVALNRDGRVLFMNQRAESLLQVSESEFIGKDIAESVFARVVESDLPNLEENMIIEVIHGNVEHARCEVEVRRQDGSHQPLGLVASAISMGGHFDGTIIGLVDISKRVEAEKAVREREARYHHLFENSPVMMMSIDENGRICNVNKRWLEEMGYHLDEALDQRFDFFAEIHKEQAPAGDLRFPWRMKTIKDAPLQLRRKSGEVMDALVNCVDTLDLHGASVGIVALQDVTAQRKVEKALAHRDAIFRAITDAAGKFLRSSDWRTVIQDALRHLGEAVEVSRVYIFQNYIDESRDLLAEHLYEWVSEGVDPKLSDPETHAFSYRANGFERWSAALDRGEVIYGSMWEFPEEERAFLMRRQIESLAAVPIFVHEGWWGILGFDQCDRQREWTITEIDALKTAAATLGAAVQWKMDEEEKTKLEAQVQQAQKMESLGILAGGIAHDFNNLLLGILGNADLALMELEATSAARDHIESVVKSSQRAAELCVQMLAYSGKGRFVSREFEISELVLDIGHLLEVSIHKKIELKYEFSNEPIVVDGDPSQIRQVVMNLIINASDAIGDNIGTITLSTGRKRLDRMTLDRMHFGRDRKEGLYAYLEVRDTGCGMDKATLERIFDPFFTTKFTGRGLGLAAVHGIIRTHRGVMDIQSIPGMGSSFRIFVPAIDKQPQPQANLGNEGFYTQFQAGGTETILLVDDEEVIRHIGQKILEKAGYCVFTAVNGREGVDIFKARQGQIDLVILDMTMPEMDGEETFFHLKCLDKDIKVVLTSGYSEGEASSRFLAEELAGFIQKPYRPNDLVEKIKTILSAGKGS